MHLKIKIELPRYHKFDWLCLVNLANQIDFDSAGTPVLITWVMQITLEPELTDPIVG